MGRSYDGNNWERVAGRHSRLDYDCSAGGSCTVTVPNADIDDYYMAAYTYTLNAGQSYARFMERASFGALPSDFQTVADSGSFDATDMADYITDQYELTPTSHREYYRTRLNPRSLEMYKYGRAGPHPCDIHSRWRKFAFTRKDKVMSVGDIRRDWPMTMHNVTLEERAVDGVVGTKYAWVYAGHVRTMSDARPKWSTSAGGAGDEIPDGIYDVCAVDEAPGSIYSDADEAKRRLYARFKIVDAGGSCNSDGQHVFGGNPDVSIDPRFIGAAAGFADDADDTPYILDFTGVTYQDLLENEIGYDPTSEGGVGHAGDKVKSDSVVYLKKSDYRDSFTVNCDAVPDPNKADFRSKGWEKSPYYEGDRHPDWDPSSRSVLDAPVFAKVSSSPVDVYRIHDRRFVSLGNTIADPLSDGGGANTIESVFRDIRDAPDDQLTVVDQDENPRTFSSISGNEQAIYCSNGEPNVFNEGECRLSTEANACVREGADDEDTIVVSTLSSQSLAAINTHITDGAANLLAEGRPLMITGLRFDLAVPDGTTVEKAPMPCTMEAVSRWMVDDSLTTDQTCESADGVDIGANTKAAFLHLLKYSVTNNDVLRDVRMVSA